MPIKINLLAETQALEDMRRRDPVKRAIWVGGFIVFLVLLWCCVLYLQIVTARSNERRLQAEWQSIEKKYLSLSEAEKNSIELEQKLEALTRYATNRFFWGSFLNGLQLSVPPSLGEKMQIIHLGSRFEYAYTEAVAAKKNTAKPVPAQPATAREKITVIIDAKDFGSSTEQNYNQFKDALARQSHVRNLLPADSILLRSLSPPSADPADQRQFVLFTLELQLPAKVRSEK